jgi:acetyl coenzyme A synthetase (ADP forming)-like protein
VTPASIDAILKPRTVAVIGASRSPKHIGHQITANLIQHGFTGSVFPVNPSASAVCSIKSYPDIGSVPDPVDLAVIVVPKHLVLGIAEECANAGVRGLAVITAGFREMGAEGAQRERELAELVRSRGMRMVGPNCLGVMNTDPAYSLNATFAPVMPPFGSAALMSQSGAMGVNILDYAREYQIGLAQFVSVGNKPDVSGNDLLMQWEDDPAVSTILMYVENFGNPRRFLELASRITKRKPIIALKAGRSASGARAASSHTGALAASNAAVDALLAQAGVLRAGSVEELFDMAMAFGATTPPRSRRTAVLTNAGGPGILAADALEANGLDVVELRPETVAAMRPLFPEEASIRNPVDMIASAQPASYRQALEILLADPGVDCAVAVFVPPFGVSQEAVAESIVSAVRNRPGKTVVAVLMGRVGLSEGRVELHAVRVPAFVFPESAARALAALCTYQEWLGRPVEVLVPLPVDRARAALVIARARAEGRSHLEQAEALELFAAYGIPVAAARVARSAGEAAAVASAIGFPVVMKVISPDIIHKSDVGGVALGIENDDATRAAYDAMMREVGRRAPDAHIGGVLVQQMVRGGLETIVGVSRDRLFGPLVMFGLGGIYVEALRDVVFRVAPIGLLDAHDMLDGIRGARILAGMRGRAGVSRDALTDVLCRVSQLAADFPEIEELDLNPLLAFEDRVVAVDARVRVADASASDSTASVNVRRGVLASSGCANTGENPP